MKVQTLGALVPLILWAGLRMFALAVVSRYIVAHGESDTVLYTRYTVIYCAFKGDRASGSGQTKPSIFHIAGLFCLF